MSWISRVRGRRASSISSTLRALRSAVLRDGERVFLVVGPSIDRRYFASFDQADNFAADMASCFLGDAYFAQERSELDGIQVLVRSREWSFHVETGVAFHA